MTLKNAEWTWLVASHINTKLGKKKKTAATTLNPNCKSTDNHTSAFAWLKDASVYNRKIAQQNRNTMRASVPLKVLQPVFLWERTII